MRFYNAQNRVREEYFIFFSVYYNTVVDSGLFEIVYYIKYVYIYIYNMFNAYYVYDYRIHPTHYTHLISNPVTHENGFSFLNDIYESES